MEINMNLLQRDAGWWHEQRFPDADCENVLLKAMEELGEVASAWNAMQGKNSATGHEDGSAQHFVDEAADVVIVLMCAIHRWVPGFSLADAVDKKIITLLTPGAHKASILS